MKIASNIMETEKRREENKSEKVLQYDEENSKIRLLAKMLEQNQMSALLPQKQLGTPPMGGRNYDNYASLASKKMQ